MVGSLREHFTCSSMGYPGQVVASCSPCMPLLPARGALACFVDGRAEEHCFNQGGRISGPQRSGPTPSMATWGTRRTDRSVALPGTRPSWPHTGPPLGYRKTSCSQQDSCLGLFGTAMGISDGWESARLRLRWVFHRPWPSQRMNAWPSSNATSPFQALLVMTAAHNACQAQQADP